MSDPRFTFTPVVIIGAARSGTNALRDMLTALPGFETWPCDEINPIWRHGNLSHPDDAIPPSAATPKVRSFIRGAFRRIWRETGTPCFVVEKTCANSLRVPFVDTILPEARYIYIVRDGIDVVASASRRWQGKMEIPALPYFLAKARYAPRRDLPAYGWSFLRARLGMLSGRKGRLSVWGPRFPGMDSMTDASLGELCAAQWAACVSASDAAFQDIAPDRVLHLKYESLVADPVGTLGNILHFLGATPPPEAIARASATVRATSVGKGRTTLPDLPEPVLAPMRATLAAHGYGAS
ncbi:sulfotransferase family protein [Oceanibium sediminis]|uniref:sulfotransferase family protein n=1 Tax=Oceanibium sediminis TaxID=2026339 RepID=UPI000DD37906|nr:sulfotransferase [Oceanibium sediminis]